MSQLVIGQAVGNYLVEEEIGRGAMGTVYRARHQVLGRPAAVKVLLPGLSKDEDLVRRFVHEAQALARIEHPGIVRVFDCGVVEGQAHIAMELLQGETLAGYLSRFGSVPSVAAARKVGAEIAAALGAAHAKGIVHRDLKPENVFLAREPGTGAVAIKILDFGVAKLLGDKVSLAATLPGSVLGTPPYMSPEQCRGQAIDLRSDLYSLGCVLFEIVAGRPPFDRRSTGEMIAAHLGDPPPTLASLGCAVTAEDDALVGRLLSKAREQRPSSAEEVRAALAARADARPLADLVYEGRGSPGPLDLPGAARPADEHTLALAVVRGTVQLAQGHRRHTTFSQTAAEISSAPPIAAAPPDKRRRVAVVLAVTTLGAAVGIGAAVRRGSPREGSGAPVRPVVMLVTKPAPALPPTAVVPPALPPAPAKNNVGTAPSVANDVGTAPAEPSPPAALPEDGRARSKLRRRARSQAEPAAEQEAAVPGDAKRAEDDELARPTFEDPDGQVRAAQRALARGDYRSARELVERALRVGRSPRGYQILAICACALGDAKGAVAAYSKLTKSDRALARAGCVRHGLDPSGPVGAGAAPESDDLAPVGF